MRIVELVDSLEIGGAERLVADLSLALTRRGHSITVVCLRNTGPLEKPLAEAGIEVVTLQKQSGFSPKQLRALHRYLVDHRIDVVHTHNPLVHHYGALAGRSAGVPAVVNTFHGPGNLTGFGRKQLIFDASCLLSDRVVACCGAVGEHLRTVTLIAKRRLTVIPNGIPLEKFTAVRPKGSEAEFVFGAVGRLVPVKDHTTLLRAFATVSLREPRCKLEILGDGPLRGQLEGLAQELGLGGRVSFHGSSLDVPSFLGRVDAFVLCSLSEGLPLTLIEAMATGRPVVGTAVGAIPEMVQAAKCGWLCPAAQPERLAEALLACCRADGLVEMGRRGREYALTHHTVESMTAGYENLFDGLLERKGIERTHLKGPRKTQDHSPECIERS